MLFNAGRTLPKCFKVPSATASLALVPAVSAVTNTAPLGACRTFEKIGVIGEVGLRHSGRTEAWVIVVAHFKRLGARIDMVVSLKHHIDPKVVNQRCQRLPNAPDISIFERMVAL